MSKQSKELQKKLLTESKKVVVAEPVAEEAIVKPVYRFGWLGYILAKVCIQFTRWLADKVFGAFANWVEKKLKK